MNSLAQPMQPVYLLTGRPGTGKTSLIKQAVAELKVRAGGFYTEEIRGQGIRLSFKMVTLDGKEAILSHVAIHSRYRVGSYRHTPMTRTGLLCSA